MPIYEYRCRACGHELEALQKLSEDPLRKCPACGKNELAKLVSAAGFQLKGSGWYATDFRNSGAKPPAKDASKGEAKTDGGTAKTDDGTAKTEAGTGKSEPASAESAKPDAKPKGDVPPASTGTAKTGT
jgi:putative FmdB family regulatory protein